MSKTKSGPSFFAICMHVVLILLTGGIWLVPLGIFYVSSRVHGRRPSFLSVVMNTFMVLITGGLWLIPLGIYYLTRK